MITREQLIDFLTNEVEEGTNIVIAVELNDHSRTTVGYAIDLGTASMGYVYPSSYAEAYGGNGAMGLVTDIEIAEREQEEGETGEDLTEPAPQNHVRALFLEFQTYDPFA